MNISLGDAIKQFLDSLPEDEREENQAEVLAFLRWFGEGKPFERIKPFEIGNYAQKLPVTDTYYNKKLTVLRRFFIYAKKQGWSQNNLGTHLKAKKAKKTKTENTIHGKQTNDIVITREGYKALEAELAELKIRQPLVIAEVQKAAADKDFRENAPLAAAKEEQGHIVGRIKEIETTLHLARIAEDANQNAPTYRVKVGDTVILLDNGTGEELTCKIVGPQEVDSLHGKISYESPIGQAVLNCYEGATVEVKAPAGKQRFKLKAIK